MASPKELLVLGVLLYLFAGVHAVNLVRKGVEKEGWLFNIYRYRGKTLILVEAWEAVFSLLTVVFAFFCWWLILPMYYTGPIAQERKSKA